MKIEIGKEYRTGRGDLVTIGGETLDYPGIYWALSGNWYRADGAFVRTLELDGDFIYIPSWHDIVREA